MALLEASVWTVVSGFFCPIPKPRRINCTMMLNQPAIRFPFHDHATPWPFAIGGQMAIFVALSLEKTMFQSLAEIRQSLSALHRKLDQMALDLSTLNAAVAQEAAVDQSVITLLTTLAGELSAANDAGDQTAIAGIVSTMQANAANLAAAVAANTPATPPATAAS